MQPPGLTQTIQRATISNLSPASEQGTAAPNMLEPYNNQPSLITNHPSQLPAVNAPTCAMLPVPTQLRQQIINGEYIDFGVLLVKTSKVEGPTTCLIFLRVVIDTKTLQASISMERKLDLLMELQNLHSLPKCTKHQLVGKLSFACKAIPAGRIFLRRLIDLCCKVKRTACITTLTSPRKLA